MVYRKPNYSISDWNTNFQRKYKAIVTLTVIHYKHFFSIMDDDINHYNLKLIPSSELNKLISLYELQMTNKEWDFHYFGVF